MTTHTTIKPIQLRPEEYSRYIQQNKLSLEPEQEGSFTIADNILVSRCCADYGLELSGDIKTEKVPDHFHEAHNIVLRIKGSYTLPRDVHVHTEAGMVPVRPLILHDQITSKHLHELSAQLIQEKKISAPMELDEEYLYEALSETWFTIAMEEVVQMGPDIQMLQVTFTKDGSFSVIPLNGDL